MRVIGHLLDEGSARRFGDHLYAQGIENEIEPEANGTFAVWVAAEEHISSASGMLADFRQRPDDPKYDGSRELAQARREQVRADNEAAAARIVDRRRLFPKLGGFGVGPLTFLLIGACVAVAFMSELGAKKEPIQSLFISWEERGRGFAGEPLPEIRRGEVWRVVSPMFIHFGPLHLIFNAMWLFDLGSLIEARRGTLRFALLVLVLAAASNLAQYFWHGPAFGGMSGVVYGLFGFAWMRGKFEPSSGLFMPRQTVNLMLIWFVVCFTELVGPIANMAHGAGLGVGALWGWLGSTPLVRRK